MLSVSVWGVPPSATTADASAWARVAHLVRSRRAELDLTQDDLGVSKAVASALENGRQVSYTTRTLARVCRALGWTPDSIDRIIVGGEPEPVPTWPAVDVDDGHQVDADVASAILELQARIAAIEVELAELRAASATGAEFGEELRRREGRRPAAAGVKRRAVG